MPNLDDLNSVASLELYSEQVIAKAFKSWLYYLEWYVNEYPDEVIKLVGYSEFRNKLRYFSSQEEKAEIAKEYYATQKK